MSTKIQALCQKGVITLFVILFLSVHVSAEEGTSIKLFNLEGEFTDSRILQYDEEMLFKVCTPGSLVETIVKCDERVHLIDMVEWDGCSLGNFDLSSVSCGSVSIESTYSKDGLQSTLEKDVPITKRISIVENLFSLRDAQGNFGGALETAYVIKSLTLFDEKYDHEKDEALEWLKQNRNNEKKCWPKEECDPLVTAQIFELLSHSKINTTLRVYRDAKTYIEDLENYIYDSDWTAEIIPRDAANCTFTQDSDSGDSTTQFQLLEGKTKEIPFTAHYNDIVKIVCSEDTHMFIENGAGKNVYRSQISRENLSYTLDGPCWTRTEAWKHCDGEMTLTALAGDISAERRAGAEEWLLGQLKSDGTSKKYFDVKNKTYYSGLYVSNIDQNPAVVDWLVYNQNNDGSWDDGDTANELLTTAQVYTALKEVYSDSHELIKDAKLWLLQHYPDEGFKTIEENAVVLPIIYNDLKPILRAEPSIVLVENQTTQVTLVNPTPFNLKDVNTSFSKDVKEYLFLGDDKLLNISSNTTAKINIQTHSIPDGVYHGHMNFFKENYTYLSLPIKIRKHPDLAIVFKSSWVALGDQTTIEIAVDKSETPFNCVLSLTGTLDVSENFRLQKSGIKKIPLRLNTTGRFTHILTGAIDCVTVDEIHTFPAEFVIKQYPQKPFVLPKKEFKVTRPGKDIHIPIENLVDDNITVSAHYSGSRADLWDTYMMRSEERIILAPGETGKILLQNNFAESDNVSMNITLDLVFEGYVQKVIIRVTIQHSESNVVQLSLYGMSGVMSLSALFFLFKRRDKIKKALKERKLSHLFRTPKSKNVEEDDLSGKYTENEERLLRLTRAAMSTMEKEMYSITEALHITAGKDKSDLISAMQQSGFAQEEIQKIIEESTPETEQESAPQNEMDNNKPE